MNDNYPYPVKICFFLSLSQYRDIREGGREGGGQREGEREHHRLLMYLSKEVGGACGIQSRPVSGSQDMKVWSYESRMRTWLQIPRVNDALRAGASESQSVARIICISSRGELRIGIFRLCRRYLSGS